MSITNKYFGINFYPCLLHILVISFCFLLILKISK